MQKSSLGSYTVTPVYNPKNLLEDIIITYGERVFKLLGSAGIKRETDIAQNFLASSSKNCLPVLLGSGLGACLSCILENTTGPVAIVDKEEKILKYTELDKQNNSRLYWIRTKEIQTALNLLTQWQRNNANMPFAPCVLPSYLRLDRTYYGNLNKKLQISQNFNFWEKINYPRFKAKTPKILLLTSQYFLIGEIIEACKELNIEYQLLQIDKEGMLQNTFVEKLLFAVLKFQPDFIFTINHLGVDREGLLTELLAQLKMPLASWFVDNPHLILYQYKGLNSPWVSIFTWDADNLTSLYKNGFEHVFYLPLAATPQRFKKDYPCLQPAVWRSNISFVGNSMLYKVAQRMKAAKPNKELLMSYKAIAHGFAMDEERSVYAYIKSRHPKLLPAYEALDSQERRLSYETMITWEATRQYRNSCLKKIFSFYPLIVGDKGWKITFKQESSLWRWHHEINYYDELPLFYPLSEINFNCTSKQMKGAVNQRVFDVPSAGAFVLTDWREQMDNLFEPHKEVVYYKQLEEIPEMVNFYLHHPESRHKIIKAAQRRILSEHTYKHRLLYLIQKMKEIYSL